ncbi:hypothetical protein KKE60_04375 [Patescibacteria group bacterium]|nr:hypothetical protein [Patescibacteria group bacterium]
MKLPWSKKARLETEEPEMKRQIHSPPSKPYIHSRNYPLPVWELKQDTKRDFRLAAVRALEARCFGKTGIENLNLRQLLAKDLGLRSWRTPPQIAGERTVWINCELAQNQFIAITGIIQLSKNPKVSDIIIRMGHAGCITLGVCEIDELYSILPIIKKLEEYREDDELFSRFEKLENIRMAAYFSEPYVFDEYHVVHITVESPEGNKTGDRLMLSGFVMEPTGMTIS